MKLRTFLLFAILVIGFLSGPIAANAEKKGQSLPDGVVRTHLPRFLTRY